MNKIFWMKRLKNLKTEFGRLLLFYLVKTMSPSESKCDGNEYKIVATPLGSMAHNLYALHRQGGNGHLDFSSIFQFRSGKNARDDSVENGKLSRAKR
jgi:hypothetical protein